MGRLARAIALGLSLSVAAPIAVQAQSGDMRELLNRVDRLQRELSTLQSHVYRGSPPPAAAATGGAGSQIDNNIAARLHVRVSALEKAIGDITGRQEEQGFQLQQISDRLDRLVADVDARLTALERGQVSVPGQGATNPTMAPSGNATQNRAASVPPPPPSGVNPGRSNAPDAPPQSLGTLPRSAASQGGSSVGNGAPAAQQQAAATPTVTLPEGTPQKQYDYALSLMLQKQNVAEAESALTEFIRQNPEHVLAGNAHYWLGETHYVRKDYQSAAFAFADGFQKFPKSTKAPDNLLKLGMSLDRLGKQQEACTAYARLLANFPKASRTLKRRVGVQQKRSKCP